MFSYLITLIYGTLLGNWEHLEPMTHNDAWEEKHSFYIHSHVLEDKKYQIPRETFHKISKVLF